ncbi:MAG: flippase-like domain-containing protein [Spirochaetes bacterium]|nr:flippase-like domain-containing protein [Spirochaetota bacterium]
MKLFKFNKSRIIFLFAGVIILLLLFKNFGISKFFNDLREIGWRFIIIVSLFLFNNVILTFAWKVLINYRIKWRKFYLLVLARIAGDSTSSINSMGAVAGEPLKAIIIKTVVPFKTGLASVMLDRTVHTLANILLILTGIIASFFLLNLPVYISIGLLLVVLLFLGLIIYIIIKQKQGFLQFIINKLPAKFRIKILTDERRSKIEEIDKEMGFIWKSKRNIKNFYISLIMRYVSILITGTLEIYFILTFINESISIIYSMFVYIFSLFLTSIIFFMPANVGTSEASYTLALKFLGYDSVLGLSVGIIRRLRTFVWSGIGMSILFYFGLINRKEETEDE